MTDRKSLDGPPNGKEKTKPKLGAASKESAAKDQNANGAQKTSPKKRRKVNHACVYCRRSVSTALTTTIFLIPLLIAGST